MHNKIRCAYGAQRHSIRELAQLVEREMITAAECEELLRDSIQDLEKHSSNAKDSIT